MAPRNGSLIRVGLLGYGYWGPNLGRVIQASPSCELAVVADLSPVRLSQAGLIHGGIRLTDRCSEVISDRSIDAVAIATPVNSHFDLALAALSAGKHVFLEKPMTHTSAEAVRLIEESERRRLVLMVDHTFLFEPAVRAISQVISAGELGRVTSWTSERTNRGVVRNDVNVVWDLAVHDFSILDYVLAAAPSTISAVGTAAGDGGLEHAANLTLQFQECLTVRIHVDWLAPRKVRRISIRGDAGVLDYDDLNPTPSTSAPLSRLSRCMSRRRATRNQQATRMRQRRKKALSWSSVFGTESKYATTWAFESPAKGPSLSEALERYYWQHAGCGSVADSGAR